MTASCPYCGATLNFGLKFCVVCGRQTTSALNKMGSIKTNVRNSDVTRRLEENNVRESPREKTKSLRFRNDIRTLSQTIFYGLIVGALFFCAVRLVLESYAPANVRHIFSRYERDIQRRIDRLEAKKQETQKSLVQKGSDEKPVQRVTTIETPPKNVLPKKPIAKVEVHDNLGKGNEVRTKEPKKKAHRAFRRHRRKHWHKTRVNPPLPMPPSNSVPQN